jgi:hypothetical protein
VSIYDSDKMADRKNTIVCTFEASSPRLSAHDIHDWIFEALRIPVQKVKMIQIDGSKRQVYIKLKDKESVEALLRETGMQVDCKHHSGEVSHVNIALAGLGRKRVRIANLAPEVGDDMLRKALTPFGQTFDIQMEKWSTQYKYCVDNGIRIVTIHLKRHVPSNLTIAGQRVLLSYEGQPSTCYNCGETGHMIQDCPSRRQHAKRREQSASVSTPTYATVVTSNAAKTVGQEHNEGIQTAREDNDVQPSTSWADQITAEEEDMAHSDAEVYLDTHTSMEMEALPAENKGKTSDMGSEVNRQEAIVQGLQEREAPKPVEKSDEGPAPKIFRAHATDAVRQTTGSRLINEGDKGTRVGSETEPTEIRDEDIQVEAVCSPKPKKKMKTEKEGERRRERSQSRSRRMQNKGGQQ